MKLNMDLNIEKNWNIETNSVEKIQSSTLFIPGQRR